MEARAGRLLWRHIRCSTNGAHAAGHHDQCQAATLEILLRRQHATGDIAARDYVILGALQQHIDTFCAQTATERRVIHPIFRVLIASSANGNVQTRK